MITPFFSGGQAHPALEQEPPRTPDNDRAWREGQIHNLHTFPPRGAGRALPPGQALGTAAPPLRRTGALPTTASAPGTIHSSSPRSDARRRSRSFERSRASAWSADHLPRDNSHAPMAARTTPRPLPRAASCRAATARAPDRIARCAFPTTSPRRPPPSNSVPKAGPSRQPKPATSAPMHSGRTGMCASRRGLYPWEFRPLKRTLQFLRAFGVKNS